MQFTCPNNIMVHKHVSPITAVNKNSNVWEVLCLFIMFSFSSYYSRGRETKKRYYNKETVVQFSLPSSPSISLFISLISSSSTPSLFTSFSSLSDNAWPVYVSKIHKKKKIPTGIPSHFSNKFFHTFICKFSQQYLSSRLFHSFSFAFLSSLLAVLESLSPSL